MVQFKQKSLIPNIANNKAVNADKSQNTIADKRLNIAADKLFDSSKILQPTNNKILQLSY